MTNFYVTGLGVFFAAEGIANLVYWRGSRQPENRVWQLGRALRVLGGIALVGFGLFA